MTVQSDGVITVKEITVGLKRYYAHCDQHPDWKPGLRYASSQAQGDVTSHLTSPAHDGINYADMPTALAEALAEVRSQDLRVRLAQAILKSLEEMY
jgi:hypothetical protein